MKIRLKWVNRMNVDNVDRQQLQDRTTSIDIILMSLLLTLITLYTNEYHNTSFIILLLTLSKFEIL